jgi:hypothetical protein
MPAAMAEAQAPKFMRLVMSCCNVDFITVQQSLTLTKSSVVALKSIPYPSGLDGSSYPNTIRNPGIACKPPTAAVSIPYCVLAIATAEQISRYLRFAHSVDLSTEVIVGVM